ncbi:LacI family DNA-binding transcriptional regulator [Devosia sp.]|uniref:LacI family DNA-binding transcriptional regulator n=1 Tax=Devosia sp. TaxID=1871048 RepID=UPI00344F027F
MKPKASNEPVHTVGAGGVCNDVGCDQLQRTGEVKRATMREVASHAGTSVGTVSRALAMPQRVAPKTLERVREAIKELNYVVSEPTRAFKKSSAPQPSLRSPSTSATFIMARYSGGCRNVPHKLDTR